MALTAKQQELKAALYSIRDDWEFVGGIGTMLKSDEEVQAMLDYIESNKWKSISDLTYRALEISEKAGLKE